MRICASSRMLCVFYLQVASVRAAPQIKTEAEKAERDENRSLLRSPLFFLHFLSLASSNDTTHSRRAIHLENCSYIMSRPSYVTIR